MQRRAVAVLVAFFLVLGVASYALIATAEEPTITLEDPEFQLSENETFTVGDRTYTVTSIEETEDEETGAQTFEGTIEWVEPDVEMSELWDHEQTIEYQGDEWQVLIDQDADDPTEFTLEEVIDRQAILENDPDAANETVESDGEEFVNVNGELVPVEEYFPEPATQTFAEGDTLAYNDETVTVESVESGMVTVTWIADETQSEDVTHEGMVELDDGNEYLTFFPGDSTLMLTQDTTSYDAQVEEKQQFDNRMSGLTSVIVIVLLIAISLIMFAFLPSRY